jgi:hypothetical protein
MRSILTKLFVGALVAGQLAATVSVAPLYADDAKPATSAARPHIDLAFCIDTTGSMSSEIENVKAKTKELVAKLAGGKPTPVIRVGLVAYRDKGDDYVTKVFPFSDDIDKVVKDITSLKADGGGDTPEAVTEGLHATINDLKWSDDKKTLKLLFLIGDAEPNHSKLDWKAEARSAISHGIQINTLGCQGLEGGPGVTVFQEIAKLADGKFESLAYRQTVIGADGKAETVIASGGRMYKVRGKSADSWKAGAAALSARGEAESMPVAAAAPMAEAAGDMAFGGMRERSLAPGRPMATSARRGGYGGAAAPMSVSRAENNLADVVFQATKEAAAKKLNVEFKEK